jgi:hypothetical protein
VIAYRFDQPSTDLGIPCGGSNVHSPKRAFVSFFLALLDSKADNADELCVAERAEHCRAAEPIREQTQRLSIFNLEGATERFRVGLESLQSNVSIEDSVLPCEATYLNVVVGHPSSSPAGREYS